MVTKEDPIMTADEMEYWKYPSPTPPGDEELTPLYQEILDYSTLSNDNIHSLMRAKKDSIEGKNLNVLMLKALPETEKSGKLLNSLEDAILKLRYEIGRASCRERV